MPSFFQQLPRPLLVGVLLVGGVIFIYLFQPPTTVCDPQIAQVKKSQKDFLFSALKGGLKTQTGFERALDLCEYGNSPGACLDLFTGIRHLTDDLESLTGECAERVVDFKEIKPILLRSSSLMVLLAWGEKGPRDSLGRMGWLDNSHLSIFCRVKNSVEGFYGRATWDSHREKILGSLPGASGMDRKALWNRSLLSVPCAAAF